MKIAVPKEIKPQEARVGLTPSGASELISDGHEVAIQKDAGKNSGFSDREYKSFGCVILDSIEQIYSFGEMIVKVKEPTQAEYSLIKSNHLLFTYFHFASSEKLTNAMIKTGATCIAYETVEKDGRLPLLIPMSEVAGRMATQQGAKYLEKPKGGFGILLGGVPGVAPANVLILGGGVAGTEAARIAAGMGANVTLLDTNLDRLKTLNDILPANVTVLFSDSITIKEHIKTSHLIIGTVLIPGAKAPKLITKEMLSKMQPGTVLVDVAIDQGGCFETSKPTTHESPTINVNGIIHYAVTNMPGAVPNTSTRALTNATISYTRQLASKGWKNACLEDNSLAKGLNIIAGRIVYKEVAEAFSLPYEQIQKFLN
ncbi:MAG: alanine dehydrogenase [Flavobacteriaceae bacterium]|nr:alanine dehydrogenase [Flavobacteriaceae bacterium]|tara:strand:- start:19031 stop:20143 length:1113 start_codon:yes stop_codon:yes gene_type:complete